MKKFFGLLVAMLFVASGISPAFSSNFDFEAVGKPVRAPSGITLSVDSLELVEKSGSMQLLITYTQANETSDVEIDEGSFKLFFTDGSSTPQYGFFNSLFPSDTLTRSYVWEWVKGKEPWLIEWEAGFFASEPSVSGLKWKVGAASPNPSPQEEENKGVLPKTFVGGALKGDAKLSRKNSPYSLESGIEIPDGVTLTLEAGARVIAPTDQPVFFGGGSIKISGSKSKPVWVTGGKVLWSPTSSLTSSLSATYLNARGIGALMPSETSQIGTLTIKSSSIVGAPSSEYKTVIFDAKSITFEKTYFENIPGFELQNQSGGKYRIRNNWFKGNSRTYVPGWGMNGEWILTDKLDSFAGNYFYDFDTPVLFKLWSKNTLTASSNFFDGYSRSELSKIRRLDPVQRTGDNNAGVKISKTISKLKAPPKIEASPDSVSVSVKWSGSRMTVTVAGAESPSRVRMKISGKWSQSKVFEKAKYSFSMNKLPGADAEIYVNSEKIATLATPPKTKYCSEIWKMFDGGISQSSQARNKGKSTKKSPTVHPRAYEMLRNLDEDRDGLVCER